MGCTNNAAMAAPPDEAMMQVALHLLGTKNDPAAAGELR
jgi:hypothetical protein